MDEEMTQGIVAGRMLGLGARNSDRFAAAEQQKPVTLDVLDSLNTLCSHAEEIGSKLYGLRDRLLGPEVTANGASEAQGLLAKSDLQSFAGASRSQIIALRRALTSIDRLATELNNRL